MAKVYLAVAILTEVIATNALKISNGFTRFWPSVVVLIGYGVSFYSLSLTLRSIQIGVVYAIWSGVGILLITLSGWWLYKQRLDLPGMAGIGLILAGVIVLNLFSKTAVH